MDIYRINSVTELIKGNPYVGRGIVAGCSPDGRAVSAYFIMGRSSNSRNRIFALKDRELFTEPFDDILCILYLPNSIFHFATFFRSNRNIVYFQIQFIFKA